jgi:putative spermidine/putrescine transport system substrate-binding protein
MRSKPGPARPRLAVRLLAPALAALLCACGGSKPEADPNVVVVHVGGGSWAEANMEAYVRPFEKETGIKVVGFADDLKVSQLKLMHDADSVEVDVIDLTFIDAARAGKLGMLEDIDFNRFDPAELAGIPENIRRPWGAPSLYYSMVVAWDSRLITTAPTGWKDFWDAARFPGKRTMYTGQYGDGPWEEALIADGVPPDQVYPIDVDRVFRSLDRIRPHMTKWWRVGSDGQQLLRDRQVAIGQVYDGRINDAAAAERGIHFTYDQGKLLLDYWVIPKKAPHKANAQRFVEFAMRASQQALFAQKIAYGPTNLRAYDHMDPAVAKRLPSHPDNLARQFVVSPDWYATTGADGMDNVERMIKRWNKWVLE